MSKEDVSFLISVGWMVAAIYQAYGKNRYDIAAYFAAFAAWMRP